MTQGARLNPSEEGKGKDAAGKKRTTQKWEGDAKRGGNSAAPLVEETSSSEKNVLLGEVLGGKALEENPN